MSPLMLRQLWALVETTQAQTILTLDDDSLVQWLLRQLRHQRAIDRDEMSTLMTYIHSRLPLIRDLASSRTPVCS
ncbi:MAG TPA: hypothetical protein V6C64_14645 [Microcoleaceae cyanobacterium]